MIRLIMIKKINNHMIKKVLIFVVFALCLTFSAPASAQNPQEVIKSFDSQITVESDGSMLVTETITVHSEGIEIVHGIYRDFPTKYKDKLGNNYNVGFDLISVRRDGQETKYDTAMQSNGIRIYIRDRDVDLAPGDYVFEIIYRTTGQLGFFSDHDELYWNVTGNGWAFAIEKASAEVTLPVGVENNITTTGYTGYQGSRDQNFQSSIAGNKIFFSASGLSINEGLTIVVGWPKGFVHEPTTQERQAQFIRDNTPIAIMAIGVMIVFIYYFIFWFRFGRDPKKGTIIPIYEPPQGLSPASMGFLKRMGYKNELLVSQIIAMAVKKYIKIDKTGLHYKLIKLVNDNNQDSLLPEERLIFDNIFDGRESIEIKPSRHEEISDTIQELKNYLKVNFGKYFSTNILYIVIGVILSFVVFLIPAFFVSFIVIPVVLFLGFWLSIWSMGVAAMLFRLVAGWKSIISGDRQVGLIGQTVILSLFSIPFLAAEVVVIVILAGMVGVPIVITLIILVAINFTFALLLKAPTIEGRKIMDEIEGFKWFLSVTEKDRMNFHNPPEKTPELFEKYLPYALVLGVENKWSEQFAQVFARLHEEGRDYVPVWYSGAVLSGFSASTFASSLSASMSNSISSSSSAPGSSSGFGGGGGSGGGGGGGGGGGC